MNTKSKFFTMGRVGLWLSFIPALTWIALGIFREPPTSTLWAILILSASIAPAAFLVSGVGAWRDRSKVDAFLGLGISLLSVVVITVPTVQVVFFF